MNIQAMMKQAQKMQNDIMKEKETIDKMIFTASYSSVTVSVNGKKEVTKIEISKDIELDKDDIEMLEDMILVATNNAMQKVEEETEKKLGKYGQGLNGLI